MVDSARKGIISSLIALNILVYWTLLTIEVELHKGLDLEPEAEVAVVMYLTYSWENS